MMFEKHIEFLKDTIDPDSALLDKLLAKKILPKRAITEIKAQTTLHGKNEKLLEHLKSRKKEEFLATLTEDNQEHIVNYIKSDGENGDRFRDCWPLTGKEIAILNANQESLIDRIEAVDCELVSKLYAKNVINTRQKATIQAESVSFKRNEKLLDILRMRSLKDYKATISCLKETQQEHIAVLLKRGGVTAELDIKLRNINNENVEKVIRDLLKKVLQTTSVEDSMADPQNISEDVQTSVEDAVLQNISEEVRQQSVHYISDMMERLNLKDARIGDSIILSFHCLNKYDFRKVKDELTEKHIENMFLRLYEALLEEEVRANVVVQWHRVSYNRCQNYFQDEDDDDLSTEDDDELSPCEDDLSFTLSPAQLVRRVSRIENPTLCYYPSQEDVASLLIKRLKFIFSHYHKDRKLEDFKDYDFRIYTAGSKMLQEQTRQRLQDRNAECLPSNVYGNIDALKYLSKRHVKTYKVTKETDKDLADLVADAVENPKKLFVIVADEAHFGVSKGGRGRELINTWNNEEHPNVIVILVTATPGIFFIDNTFSRIPRISVAEKQTAHGEFVVVQRKDKLRKKEIIEVETGKDISKDVGPVKELHVFNWSECYEGRFEEGLVVTLRVPQRFSKNREEQIWLSIEGLSENGLYSVVGKTNENDATQLLLRGKNNIVRITNLDESKTLVVRSVRSQATRYEIGFIPTHKMSDNRFLSSCDFKVLMVAGEDVLELEVFQENGQLRRLKYTYATSKLELGPASLDASKLDSSMTHQFLIESYRNHDEAEESGPQYLSLNFYYNSIRNLAPEEQLIRQDKNFEDMADQFRYTPADHLLATEYAYYIVLLECMRRTSPNEISFQKFISNPMKVWKEYLDHRRSKLEALKSALEDSENSVRPIVSSCFSDVVKFTEDKSWEKLHRACNRLQKQKDLSQKNIDEFYEVLIRYLMHANRESFASNMKAVKMAIKRHTPALVKTAENFKDVFNRKKVNVLCRSETFRIVSDLIQEEGIEQKQGSLNGHMKIIRASCTEMANSIYTTLTLARKVANDTDDCFFEIIRYFQRFKLSDLETNGPNNVPNRRIWQILQPKHCATYTKKSLELCRCENYDPKENELRCKNCCHPHHSMNTFFDLDRLSCIVIVVDMGRMGDTFPPSLNVMDLRARRSNKPQLPTLVQEVGRICRYQVKSSYSDLPYVLVASKVMKMLEDNLNKSVSFLESAKLEDNSEQNLHHNRLLLVGEPQIGKTGVFLKIASQLRKIIKGDHDKFDFRELPRKQTTRKRAAGKNESHKSEKRRKVCKSQSLIERKVNTPTCDSEDGVQESATASKVKIKIGASTKQHKFADLVHCTICNETFVDPRNLPCLHIFCLKCIQRVCDEKPNDALITCPMCEEEFIFPDNGCEELKENAFIKRLVDMSNISTSSFSRASCDVCESKPSQSNFEVPEARSFCEECQEKLCDECKVFHERQHHELLPLEKRHLYRSMTEFCNQHKKPLDMYCKVCCKIFCAVCLKDHKEHNEYSMVKTVVGEYRESLRKNTEAVKVAEENAKKNIPILQKEIEHLQKQYVKLERLKAVLERHLSNVEHCRTYCQELADKGTVNDVLREAAAWQTKLDEVKECHESTCMNKIQIPTVGDTVNAAIAECSNVS